ncbi:hypothetical protein [Microtetraspora sp. NBRC 16547]|uniref:hypothetical protein n=1 Tax=Microtetraspora sp. NBRC 16547 TaxID=3030993 RepID=UPI0025558EAC|nr:hypothetical protein [Microtetraspora sp. NBRC 16547]
MVIGHQPELVPLYRLHDVAHDAVARQIEVGEEERIGRFVHRTERPCPLRGGGLDLVIDVVQYLALVAPQSASTPDVGRFVGGGQPPLDRLRSGPLHDGEFTLAVPYGVTAEIPGQLVIRILGEIDPHGD